MAIILQRDIDKQSNVAEKDTNHSEGSTESGADTGQPLPFYSQSMARMVTISLLTLLGLMIAALAVAGLYLERATSKGQQAVTFSTQAVHFSLSVAELTKNLERSVRVYQVMEEDKLLDNYRLLREQLWETANQLASLELPQTEQADIEQMLRLEAKAYATVSLAEPGSAEASQAIESYADIREIARNLIAVNSREVEARVRDMRENAHQTRDTLMWLGLMAAVIVALVAVGAIPPLVRYMKALDASILRIGQGKLDKAIALRGPSDIRQLGARLEWLRRQLLMLEEQKQFFLRHFSHELKTPLASIREGTCLLVDGVPGALTKEQMGICRILERNCNNLQQQIENLLEYSVTMQPFQAYNPKLLKLDQQILTVTREHELQIRAKELSVKTKLEAIRVKADEDKLKTIIDNLFSNAVKFAPVSSAITITLQRGERGAELTVADEGPGIDPAERQRIFEAFYKIPQPDNSNAVGSGLGLSLAKHYANAHGGDIEVIDSQTGASFKLVIPIKNANG